MGLLKVKVRERSGGTGVIKVVAREAKGRDHGMKGKGVCGMSRGYGKNSKRQGN